MSRLRSLALLALAGCTAPPAPPESPIDRLVPPILERDRIPGAVVLVGGPDGVSYRRAFGAAAIDTIWDLASCTKVVATTTAAMKLVEEGRIGLHDLVSKHLPAFSGRDITVEELLTHRSGLPAYLSPKPEWAPDEIFTRITELKASKETRYSCLNMISLARLIEEVTGRPLAEVCRETIFDPLGMKDTSFAPTASRCAATAANVPPGVVHDPLARAYGTSAHRAGNAGLFSTADDLALFCRALLAGKILKPETTRRMFTPNADTRGLGWDIFDDAPYSPGVGHTGFTGTLIWMHPPSGRFALILSNRTLKGENVDVRRLRKEVLAVVNPRERSMTDDELAKEIARVWGEVRSAFIDFRLDDAKKHLEIPAGAPVPTREQARQFGEFLPDLSKGKRLKLLREGKRAGFVVLLEREVAVVRFHETAAGWKPVPGQETVSSYGGDVPLDDAKIQRLLATRGALQLTPTDVEEDLRPEAEVRKELEALAKPVRARFVGLAWAPGRVAYVAEVKPGNAKVTTAGVWRFERKDGVYALASAEEVELPPTGQAKLLKVVDVDPRFKP